MIVTVARLIPAIFFSFFFRKGPKKLYVKCEQNIKKGQNYVATEVWYYSCN